MKVTVDKEKENEIKYPCLMESAGHIVLFHKESEGVKLKMGGSSGVFVGESYNCFNMDKYKPFIGSITLEND